MEVETEKSTYGVIFLLNILPLEPEACADRVQPDSPYSFENLAATYILPIEQILLSPLNTAGFVRNIYVNFGPQGYFELNPEFSPVTQPKDFVSRLQSLFANRIVECYGTVIWNEITDFSKLISSLPPNSRKIGCLHGTDAQGSNVVNLDDYVKNASDTQPFVFVVGRTSGHEIQGYIDDYVKVSEYNLAAAHCLIRVITQMETKFANAGVIFPVWNLNDHDPKTILFTFA
ncbi:ribosomal RNA small subunit methyltransferase nep-1 [Senna tora]|uniref:Ribosomal RNA small subunit methyltransferase nep-1 n=1 Tax=Senna tora TaxID=362788 RepID=A0A834SJX8_9FABA|nr:ribosomal RNA small subunit methyltransferase nep-1 [Senna tora]